MCRSSLPLARRAPRALRSALGLLALALLSALGAAGCRSLVEPDLNEGTPSEVAYEHSIGYLLTRAADALEPRWPVASMDEEEGRLESRWNTHIDVRDSGARTRQRMVITVEAVPGDRLAHTLTARHEVEFQAGNLKEEEGPAEWRPVTGQPAEEEAFWFAFDDEDLKSIALPKPSEGEDVADS